jgi:hypothetical protein
MTRAIPSHPEPSQATVAKDLREELQATAHSMIRKQLQPGLAILKIFKDSQVHPCCGSYTHTYIYICILCVWGIGTGPRLHRFASLNFVCLLLASSIYSSQSSDRFSLWLCIAMLRVPKLQSKGVEHSVVLGDATCCIRRWNCSGSILKLVGGCSSTRAHFRCFTQQDHASLFFALAVIPGCLLPGFGADSRCGERANAVSDAWLSGRSQVV